VITVSESSRKDILTAYPFLASDKITATPLAVSPQFRPLTAGERIDGMHYLKERYSLEGDFVLSVGVLQPRKNLPMLIQAFSAARKRAGFSHKLAIAGKIGWLSSKTESAIADSRDDIVLLGYVPDEDLPLLYACAEVVVYPSLYEGFGLPVLEAMACGCPVIVSDNSSLPEVVGDAGILLPAENVTNWEEAIIRLIEHASLRSKMRTAGLSQATKFSWKETAGKTLDIYHRVARTNEIISNLSKGRK
jgi:glycosyltransferase involved in cell wall biosynthesis